MLALASVIGLVLFLAHLTRQIRVETMLVNVHQDASKSAESYLGERDASRSAELLDAPIGATIVVARASGFLVRVDESDVVSTAEETDACIRVDRMPGDFVVAGTPVATAWRLDARALTDDERDGMESGLAAALHLGAERTGRQDAGFGLRQLIDVTTKALSPGINDPTTAVHALGHVSALLGELSRLQLGAKTAVDDAGTVRVQFSRPVFGDYLDMAFTQPRHYGSSDPLVAERLLLTLRELAFSAPDQSAAVLAQLRRLTVSLADADHDLDDRARHARLAAEIEEMLAAS